MNYYYDVILNFNMEELWDFYEWEKEDPITIFKKIPLVRVSFETIVDFMKYHVQVSSEFLNSIAHKTISRDKNDDFAYTFLMSDSKNSLAVLLDDKGNVIALSHLLMEDENNMNEFMYTLKEKKIPYETKEVRVQKKGLRQERNMKRIILLELKTLYESSNIQKMKYLYYEWFNEENDDFLYMYERMKKECSKKQSDIFSHIYYLIRLSYHQV